MSIEEKQRMIDSIVALKMASIRISKIIKTVEENIKIIKPNEK